MDLGNDEIPECVFGRGLNHICHFLDCWGQCIVVDLEVCQTGQFTERVDRVQLKPLVENYFVSVLINMESKIFKNIYVLVLTSNI